MYCSIICIIFLLKCKSTITGDTQVERASLLTREQNEIPSPYLLEFDPNIHEGFVELLTRCGLSQTNVMENIFNYIL